MSHEPDPAENAPSDPDVPIHLPGAGTIGMTLLLASLSMLFLASIVALLVARTNAPKWPPEGFPPIPSSLWLSTFIILFASVSIQLAVNAIRRDDERALARWLLVTLIIGLLFLAMQTLNWFEFAHALRPGFQLQGAYLGMFYVLTGLHAAHVVGGLIPLAIVLARAAKKTARYSRNYHPGVRYLAAYWHFLDIIWVLLFCVLYF